MMHQPSGGLGGTASDIRIQAEQMLYTKNKMAELIAQHTGQTVETIERDSDRDRWFTAEEAKDYGLVDQVVTSAGPGRRLRRHGMTGTFPPPVGGPRGDRAQMSGLYLPSSRYFLPQIEERTSLRLAAHRPLHQAVRGAHHLPRPGRSTTPSPTTSWPSC